MIVDASFVIPWIEGRAVERLDELDRLLRADQAAVAPVTKTEVLAGPDLKPALLEALSGFRTVELVDGYWERAGLLRRRIIRVGRRARLGDALVAQACLDHDLPLLARDRDFDAFAQVAGLKLA